jgi:hypothetical protein
VNSPSVVGEKCRGTPYSSHSSVSVASNRVKRGSMPLAEGLWGKYEDDVCTGWVLHGPVTIAPSTGFTIKITNWNGASADTTQNAATLCLADGIPATIDDKGHPTTKAIRRRTRRPSGPLATRLSAAQLAAELREMTSLSPLCGTASIRSWRCQATYAGAIGGTGLASGTDMNPQNHHHGKLAHK